MPSVNINTPTTAVQIFDTLEDLGNDVGPGTVWPIAIPLGDTGEWPTGYAELDVATAMMIRVLQWQVSVSLSKSVTYTNNSDETFDWTETLTATSDLDLITTTDGSAPITDETIFAQHVETGLNATLDLGTTSTTAINGGGFSGTYDDGVNPPTAFSGTWDSDTLNRVSLTLGGVAIVLQPSPIAYVRLIVNLDVTRFTFTAGAGVAPNIIGFQVNTTGWAGDPDERPLAATATVRIPSVTGSGNAEIEAQLGAIEPDPDLGVDFTAFTITGSILFTPKASLEWGGVWDPTTCARLQHPLSVGW